MYTSDLLVPPRTPAFRVPRRVRRRLWTWTRRVLHLPPAVKVADVRRTPGRA